MMLSTRWINLVISARIPKDTISGYTIGCVLQSEI